MSDLPPVPIQTARRSLLERMSIVWVIPIAALIVALVVAWQSYSNQGRVVDVVFDDGAGLVANTTELRFRDINVGLVEKVQLSEALDKVVVSIRLTKEISPYVDSTSQFWVVRPELTTQGVSGLETVLTGVYIEGSWDNVAGDEASRFNGRSQTPLYHPDRPGLQIALRSPPQGQLADDGPILYRGIEVGRVGKASIDPRGNFAVAEAIIYEPHDRLITDSTRFWDTSGFSVSIGAQGAAIDFTSLASLVAGGITFDTFVSGGDRASDGTRFQVYEDEGTARNSIFNQSEVESLTVSVIFDDNISGLALEAPVELAGLRIGSVASVTGVIDRDAFGDSRVRLNAVLEIQPTRLGLQDAASPETALELLKERAEKGLRAQLATASLLSGALKVQFVEVADAPAGVVRETPEGLTILPSTQSEITDAGATVEGVLNRINDLPVETLLNSAIDFMNSATGLVTDEALREVPQDLRTLLAEINGVVGSTEVQAVAGNLNKVLTQVETLLVELETEQTIRGIVAAVDAAAKTASQLDASIAGVPALIADLSEVAKTASALPLDDLTVKLTGLVASADALMQTDGVQELPVQMNAALAELNVTLKELREGGAITNVNATLASARDAADAVAVSTKDLPALVKRLTNVLDQASTTIKGYDKGGTISRDAQAALRDIQQAAAAVSSLARTLERNPSSLIRGRN